MLADGRIEIKNASHCFKVTDEGIDTMALRILFKLFHEHQETGELPTQIQYHV